MENQEFNKNDIGAKTGEVTSFLKEKKKNIIKTIYKGLTKAVEPLTNYLSSLSLKIGLVMITMAVLSIITSGLPVSLGTTIIKIIYIASGIALIGVSGIQIAIDINHYKMAKRVYKEMLAMQESVQEAKNNELTYISSVKLTSLDGTMRAVEVSKKNTELDLETVTLYLSDDTKLSIQRDEFIDAALALDEGIFLYQYEGFEQELVALHKLIKDYVNAKDSFRYTPEGGKGQKQLLFEEGLKVIEDKINAKINAIVASEDGPVRKRNKEETN